MFKLFLVTIFNSIERFKKFGHVESIDFLRGVAAIAVMFYHLVHGTADRFDQLPWLQWITSFGHFGVQIFFVISGFVIPYSMYRSRYKFKNIGSFILRRLARLEPPYLISVLICIVLVAYRTYDPYNGGPFIAPSVPQVLLHIGYLTTYFDYKWLDSAYWTLAIEFQYYLLMAIAYPLLIKKKYGAILFCMVASALAFELKDHTLIFLHLPFFMLGISLFLFKVGRISANEALVLVGLSCVMIFVINDIQHVLCGLLALFLLVFWKWTGRFALFLGSLSYSLYLLHDPLGQSILNFASEFISNDWTMFAVLWPCSVVLIVCAWGYNRLIEQPAIQLSKKISY